MTESNRTMHFGHKKTYSEPNKLRLLGSLYVYMLTNPRDAYRGQSKSRNLVPFHMIAIVCYYCEILNMSLRCAVFPIFDFKNVATLKSASEVTQGD